MAVQVGGQPWDVFLGAFNELLHRVIWASHAWKVYRVGVHREQYVLTVFCPRLHQECIGYRGKYQLMCYSDESAGFLWSFIYIDPFSNFRIYHIIFILMLSNLVSIYFHSNEVVKYLQLRDKLLQWSVMDIFGWNYIHSYICYTKYLQISDYLYSLVVSIWCLWTSRVLVPGWQKQK